MTDASHTVLQPQPPAADVSGTCMARLFLPLRDCILTANPSAENRAWLAARYPGRKIHAVSQACLAVGLRRRFGAAVLDDAVFGLARRAPELSASRVLTDGQRRAALALLSGVLVLLCLDASLLLRLLLAFLSLAFVGSGLFRTVLAFLGTAPRPEAQAAPARGALPSYTILVPLYREAAVMPTLAAALRAIDYPADRLDIKLVMEEDDAETIAAARRHAPFEIVLVPPGGPRTKPKAANYALAFARGEYLVIYDAEDRPEPDQLRKAVARFRALPRSTACLQARLNFYNAGQNWLTRGIMAQTPQEI